VGVDEALRGVEPGNSTAGIGQSQRKLDCTNSAMLRRIERGRGYRPKPTGSEFFSVI